MTLLEAADGIPTVQSAIYEPLAVIVAEHTRSGKSTMRRRILADVLQIPLINADRMIFSILPKVGEDGHLDSLGSPASRYRPGTVETRDAMGMRMLDGIDELVYRLLRSNLQPAAPTTFS